MFRKPFVVRLCKPNKLAISLVLDAVKPELLIPSTNLLKVIFNEIKDSSSITLVFALVFTFQPFIFGG